MALKTAQYINAVLAALRKLGGSAKPGEVYAAVAQDLGVQGPALEETHASGQSKFEKYIAFMRLNLVHSGYIDRSRRGVWTLTEKGRTAGNLSDEQVRAIVLDSQREAKQQKAQGPQGEVPPEDTDAAIEDASYKTRFLELLRSLPPAGFERLCQRLLRESGFERVSITGRSGDGGIDGIGVVKVNAFVTFKVVFQCKKYSNTIVGAPQVRDFRGAMQGRADKGLILTTSSFTSDAHKEAVRDGVPPIELVDGEQLITMFEELELGLKPRTTYDLDLKFFEEFQT
jgi:restriction system protein